MIQWFRSKTASYTAGKHKTSSTFVYTIYQQGLTSIVLGIFACDTSYTSDIRVQLPDVHCTCLGQLRLLFLLQIVTSFSRKKSISDEWKSLSDSWHILVATGVLEKVREDNTTKLKILAHSKKAASTCKCNVSLCTEKCDCPDGFRYQLLKLHGEILVGFWCDFRGFSRF
jgi:hypothetical protein